MRTFDFYGENIVVSDGQENYIRLRLEMEKIASELKDQFVSQYKNKYRSMDQVVADVFNMGEGYILQAATWCIDLMGKIIFTIMIPSVLLKNGGFYPWKYGLMPVTVLPTPIRLLLSTDSYALL